MRNKVDTDREKYLISQIKRLEIVIVFSIKVNKKIRKITNQPQESIKT